MDRKIFSATSLLIALFATFVLVIGAADLRAEHLDHFLCYTVKISKGAAKFTPINGLSLEDQYEQGSFNVTAVNVLCVPAQKESEPLTNPDIHLMGYAIQAATVTPTGVPRTNVSVVNQLGALTVNVGAAGRLLVPSLKSLNSDPGPPDPASHDVDHFKCYAVTLSSGSAVFPKGLQKFVVDQFNQGKIYNVTGPSRLCVPVDKEGEQIKRPQNELMCYAVAPAKKQPKHRKLTRLHVNNQFGPETLDTVKDVELCVPPANGPPQAVDDVASTTTNTPVNISVLNNDTDPEGDPFTVTSFTQGGNGKVTCTASTCTYTPSLNFTGSDSFTYTISDGFGGTATAKVNVKVNLPPPVNQAPIVNAGTDQTITLPASANLDGTVTDDNLPAPPSLTTSWTKVSGPGTVTFGNDLAVDATAGFSQPGIYVLRLTANDGQLQQSDDVEITVNPAVVGCPAPVITSIDVLAGPVGTEVTITGTNLDCGDVRNLTLNGVPAVITFISATTIKTFIPVGAQDGLFSYTTDGGTTTAPPQFAFDVTSSSDFALVIAPTEGKVIQGTSASYSVQVNTLGGQPFTGLANLEVLGVPNGLNASFFSNMLTGGQRGTLTVSASSNASLGTAPLTLRATATIDAQSVAKTTNFDVTVLQGNRSALLGQFMLKNGPPMPGVILSLISQTDGSMLAQTVSDAGGNFQFLDPPAGVLTLSVDTTPFDPTRPFPIYGADVTIVAGAVTVLPVFTITPPPPPQAFVAINNATQDQVVTNPDIPGVSITLPAGVTVTGWDGQLKTKITIVKLSPDELPMLPPPGPTKSLYQFNFGTSMGGLPTVPLPITFPNDHNANPGEKIEIWFYDAAPFVGVPGAWKKAGLGTVSQDGRFIVSDPGVGIDRF